MGFYMQGLLPPKKGKTRPVALLFIIALLGMMLCPYFQAVADDFKVTPALGIKEEYNDNILYWVSDVEKDFITTVSPELTLTEKTERLDLKLWGKLDRRIYNKHSELDATDQYYEGTAKFAFTERLNLSGRIYYSNDSRPDGDLETSGLTISEVDKSRQNYSIAGDYALTELTLTTFSYEYLNDEYNNSNYSDIEAHTFNFGIVHDLSYFFESTQGRTNIGYVKYNIPTMGINDYSLTVGVNKTFNEKWSLLADTGIEYTTSNYSFLEEISTKPLLIIQKKGNEQSWGWVGQMTLAYKGDQENASLNFVHNVLPAGGRSGASKRTSLIFRAWKKMTQELYMTFYCGFYMNRSKSGQFSLEEIDEDAIGVTPGIRYQINDDTALEALYTYNRTKHNDTGEVAQRNSFQLRFRMQHNLFD